ncbi:hypothetical protein ACFLXN_00700 [Chloroflexota bacterium]
MEWDIDIPDDAMNYELCPECGRLSFVHDEGKHQHVCVNEECGFAVSEGAQESGQSEQKDSIWTKILRLLKLKR